MIRFPQFPQELTNWHVPKWISNFWTMSGFENVWRHFLHCRLTPLQVLAWLSLCAWQKKVPPQWPQRNSHDIFWRCFLISSADFNNIQHRWHLVGGVDVTQFAKWFFNGPSSFTFGTHSFVGKYFKQIGHAAPFPIQVLFRTCWAISVSSNELRQWWHINSNMPATLRTIFRQMKQKSIIVYQ